MRISIRSNSILPLLYEWNFFCASTAHFTAFTALGKSIINESPIDLMTLPLYLVARTRRRASCFFRRSNAPASFWDILAENPLMSVNITADSLRASSSEGTSGSSEFTLSAGSLGAIRPATSGSVRHGSGQDIQGGPECQCRNLGP